MRTKTTHLVEDDGQWLVRRVGERLGLSRFRSKRLALEAARQLLAGERAWQIVSLHASGRVRVEARYGLPKIRGSPAKSTLGRRAIERAVVQLIRKRLEE
jgi:hypothetical protein